jgi:hypothetical protein
MATLSKYFVELNLVISEKTETIASLLFPILGINLCLFDHGFVRSWRGIMTKQSRCLVTFMI